MWSGMLAIVLRVMIWAVLIGKRVLKYDMKMMVKVKVESICTVSCRRV